MKTFIHRILLERSSSDKTNSSTERTSGLNVEAVQDEVKSRVRTATARTKGYENIDKTVNRLFFWEGVKNST
jgi:hypothetical protein